MKDTQEELERIQRELLTDDTVSLEEILEDKELEELLNDQELNKLLWQQEEAPEQTEKFQNFANGYAAEEPEQQGPENNRDDKLIIGLMATASVLSLGIIGVLTYWLTVLL